MLHGLSSLTVKSVKGQLLCAGGEAIKIFRALQFYVGQRLYEFSQRGKVGVAVVRRRYEERRPVSQRSEDVIVIEGKLRRSVGVKA